jgi:hypothetical protein
MPMTRPDHPKTAPPLPPHRTKTMSLSPVFRNFLPLFMQRKIHCFMMTTGDMLAFRL